MLNIRDNTLADGKAVTATIYTSPCGFTDPSSTKIVATLNGPSSSEDPHCLATATGSFPVSAGSLLSVQIATTGGALDRGVAVTVFLTIP